MMRKEVVTVEREIGIWGTRFKADLEVSGNSVKLVKGYVKGFTGMSFSAGGQALGFGISDWDFWLTEEDQDKASTTDVQIKESGTVFKVFVSFRRIRLLMFNERQTLLVGEYTLEHREN